MLEQIVDLHIHSKYSRACSKALELPNIAKACEKKGIDIAATGDFTHPAWSKHIADTLLEENEGVYRLKDGSSPTRFVLGTEIACIYKHKDAVRRLHLLVLAPSIQAAAAFTAELERRHVNVKADGRPMMGLSAKTIVQICLDIDERFMVIPAHAWTPWFAVFGSKSGYDSLEDCFEELTPHIRAIETGLSSDPVMNRRLSPLDGITLISNSDAHGLDNLGREANVLQFSDEQDITYAELTRIIKEGDRTKFLYTIEFYPEEGKYHLDGHRDCDVKLDPGESKQRGDICPVCKKKLTIGVLHRVDDLADREQSAVSEERFIPQRSIVPLREVIGQIIGVGVASKKVAAEYSKLIAKLGSEFFILLHASPEAIEQAASYPGLGPAIANMRAGTISVQSGYDGVYGTVDVLGGKKYGPRQSALF